MRLGAMCQARAPRMSEAIRGIVSPVLDFAAIMVERVVGRD
jgi:hypothetical protein